MKKYMRAKKVIDFQKRFNLEEFREIFFRIAANQKPLFPQTYITASNIKQFEQIYG